MCTQIYKPLKKIFTNIHHNIKEKKIVFKKKIEFSFIQNLEKNDKKQQVNLHTTPI